MQEERIFLTALFIAVIMILPAEYASSRGVLIDGETGVALIMGALLAPDSQPVIVANTVGR